MIKPDKIETTTRSAFSDACDAREITNHPGATDDERTAAAHVMAAYDLHAVCERSDIATVQTAGRRLGLW